MIADMTGGSSHSFCKCQIKCKTSDSLTMYRLTGFQWQNNSKTILVKCCLDNKTQLTEIPLLLPSSWGRCECYFSGTYFVFWALFAGWCSVRRVRYEPPVPALLRAKNENSALTGENSCSVVWRLSTRIMMESCLNNLSLCDKYLANGDSYEFLSYVHWALSGQARQRARVSLLSWAQV